MNRSVIIYTDGMNERIFWTIKYMGNAMNRVVRIMPTDQVPKRDCRLDRFRQG